MAETVKTRLDPTPPEDGIKPEKKGTGKKIIAGIAALGVAAAGVVGFNSINDDKEAPLGSGPVAEAPANPGTGSSSESISEISPEILQAFEAISVSQAEQESGVTAEQIREYVKDPANTEYMQYLRDGGIPDINFRPSPEIDDPFALEAKIALDDTNLKLLESLLQEKRITPERLLELYNWYRDNMEQIKIYLAQPDLLENEKEMLKYAQFSQVVIASIIEKVVSGQIEILNEYEEKVDPRIEELYIYQYGSEDRIISYFSISPIGEVFMPTINNGSLDMSLSLDVESYPYCRAFSEHLSYGTFGPYQAHPLVGINVPIERRLGKPDDIFNFLER